MDEPTLDHRHVQVSFFTNDDRVATIPEAVFDVPLSATQANLNALVNESISQTTDEWKEMNFELLIGETFLRSSLAEFIEEYTVDTERVIRIECILGIDPPKPLHDLPTPDWVGSVHALEKLLVATTFHGDIILWNTAGKKLGEFPKGKGEAYKCSEILKEPTGKDSSSGNGLTLALSGLMSTISIYECVEGSFVEKQQLRGHERTVNSLSLSKDETRMISGSIDSHLKVWNMEENAPQIEKAKENDDNSKRRKVCTTMTPMVTLGGHKDSVTAVRWSTHNPSHCISASADHTIATWDLELAGEISRIRHSKAYTSIDVNKKNGLVIAGSADALPRLYDTRSTEGNVVKQSYVGHRGWISSVAWHMDQENVFATGSYDNVVKMWDVRSGKTSLFDLHGHDDRVFCVASGPNGIVASGGADSALKVYGN